MTSLNQIINRMLNGTIAVCLSFMSLFVFSNVILRYFFNSSVTWTEEASRYLFIWLIFLGAVVASRENAHLGVDTLVRKLSVKARRLVFIFSNILLVITMALCTHGTWKLTLLTHSQASASLRLPLSFVYVSGLICCAAMTVIALANLYRLVTNKVRDEDLVMTVDSEDDKIVDQISGKQE